MPRPPHYPAAMRPIAARALTDAAGQLLRLALRVEREDAEPPDVARSLEETVGRLLARLEEVAEGLD